MSYADNSGVEAAFDLVLAEMQKAIEKLNELGADAFKNGDHATARQILQEVELRQNLIPEVVLLRSRWLDLQITKGRHDRRKRRGSQISRPGRGEITPRSFFRFPILKALVEVGGSSDARDVQDRVFEMVKDSLKPADLMPLPSYPNEPRWRNSVRWERFKMVEEGLLRNDSPRGT